MLTYAYDAPPWGVRVDELADAGKVPTRKVFPLLSVNRSLVETPIAE